MPNIRCYVLVSWCQAAIASLHAVMEGHLESGWPTEDVLTVEGIDDLLLGNIDLCLSESCKSKGIWRIYYWVFKCYTDILESSNQYLFKCALLWANWNYLCKMKQYANLFKLPSILLAWRTSKTTASSFVSMIGQMPGTVCTPSTVPEPIFMHNSCSMLIACVRNWHCCCMYIIYLLIRLAKSV